MSEIVRVASLSIDSLEAVAEIHESEPIKSRFTSRLLRCAEAVLRDPNVAAVQNIIESAQRVEQVSEGATRWTVKGTTFDLNDGPAAVLRLEEHENLVAAKIDFPGFSITPELYKEDVFDEVQLVQMLTRPIPSDKDQFADFLYEISSDERSDQASYFPVIRHGVENSPLAVRFGRVLWDQTDSGRRYLITLVSETGDDESTKYGVPQPWSPMLNRLVDHATEFDVRISRIEAALQSASLLEPTPYDDDSREAFEARMRYSRVNNKIENFF
ncbi:hypothetical protein ACPPVW_11765 [Leifsonia sp. McL0607]|uniref:hypothetical protein n=1 Tax=Leifsonia sp. McL0607 TaxID=3415672 RepID=UPI003CEF2103